MEITSASMAPDRFDDVVELRVAHVRVNLRLVADARGGKPEAFDRPSEVARPVCAAQAAGPREARARRSE